MARRDSIKRKYIRMRRIQNEGRKEGNRELSGERRQRKAEGIEECGVGKTETGRCRVGGGQRRCRGRTEHVLKKIYHCTFRARNL